MKKLISALFLSILLIASLSSCCFTEHPDMVEYSEDEVLSVAKEKYNIESFIFKSYEIHGEVDKEGDFKIKNIYDNCQLGTAFIDPVNLENAFSSFAGKNGGHDIQGMYRNFLCYCALGVTSDNEAKFVYYNTNLHKDAMISDTVGISDYPYDILPTDIDDNIHSVDGNWFRMNQFLSHAKGDVYFYNKDYLSKEFRLTGYRGKVVVKYYRENGNIVYDVYYSDRSEESYNGYEEPKLCYSTSEKYGVIYNYYGFDYSPYIDVSYSVGISSEQTSCDLIKGEAKIKDIGKGIVYSELSVSVEYYMEKEDGTPIRYSSSTGMIRGKTELSHGAIMDRIDGIDHRESAEFLLTNFYILYEKDNNTK